MATSKIYLWVPSKNSIDLNGKIRSNQTQVLCTIVLYYFLFNLQYMMQIDMFLKQVLGLMSEKQKNKQILRSTQGAIALFKKGFSPLMFQIEYRSLHFALNFKQTSEKKEVLINVLKNTMKFNKILELGLPSLDKSTPSSLSTS